MGTEAPANGRDDARIETFERMASVSGRAQQLMLEFWSAQVQAPADPEKAMPGMPGMPGMKLSTETGARMAAAAAETLSDWSRIWATADPASLARLTTGYWADALKLWSGVLGAETDVPALKDKRFQGEAWGASPVFDLVRRSYLLASRYLTETVSTLGTMEPGERERLLFQTRQFVEAMSPANFALMNPEVLAEAKATNGESLVTGLANMLDDLKRGKLTMTDEAAFEVGRNVAASPGKVVFENRLFQLIHYQPTTAQVHEIPLVIFPPWINKFYILDLTPEKSFIQWALSQGLSVFMASWAQGNEALADVLMENYVLEGELQAIDTVLQICKAPAVNAIGYCVAGTTLAATLAYMAATGQAAKVCTATFFTTQVDFADGGDLKTLVDPQMIETARTLSAEKGYLDGRYLASTFNLLRPGDLIWNYVVNNYLKGKPYTPFDLLYWNSDPTNVPGKWHVEYLEKLYHENQLVVPGGISIAGVPIDLKRVETPCYIQAGREDHIAPAVSCFKLTKAFSGPHRFMLAGSGHVAGVVNPPSARKYGHWILPDGVPTPETLEGFCDAAIEQKGSWWPDWARWIGPQSGPMVKPRVPGTTKGFPAIEEAPGRYVKERIA